jgi:ribosome-associated protein
MIEITPEIILNENELHFDFVRATGPGGQNVNKVATAVQLRFDVANSAALPPEVRERLLRLAGKRVTSDGILLIEARRFRSQERNRQDALNRLIALIRQATEKPKPRRKTKLPQAVKEQRLAAKRRRSETKRRRQSHHDE